MNELKNVIEVALCGMRIGMKMEKDMLFPVDGSIPCTCSTPSLLDEDTVTAA